MRYLVFSDIHGNLEALAAVLRLAEKKKIDHYVCLGDLVGYGASPERDHPRNPPPQAPVHHPRQPRQGRQQPRLDRDLQPHRRRGHPLDPQDDRPRPTPTFCTRLPQGPADRRRAVHHLPRRAVRRGLTTSSANSTPTRLSTTSRRPWDSSATPISPSSTSCARAASSAPTWTAGEIKLEEGPSYLINPGSVGQPRDRNRKAACVIYDTEHQTVRFHRLDYDIASAQKRIRAAELPARAGRASGRPGL